MIERKVIIGLITSTDYCTQIKSIWNTALLESATAKRMAGWCWEYFDKYQKAPGGDIEGIFFSKIKAANFPKTMAEEIEQDILPSLSKEHTGEPFDLTYLLDETKKYFNERHLTLFKEQVSALLLAGQTSEAEKMIYSFKPLKGITHDINDFIRSIAQIRREKKKSPMMFMKPWLRAGQVTIIYGQYGTGKSLLALLVAYMLGTKNFMDHDIDEWLVKNQTGCLYLDGEIGELEMEERFSKFEWMGCQQGEYRMKIFSVPEYQLATEDSFFLSSRENQMKIIRWLKEHSSYQLVILDSASTLFGLEDENSNSEWNNKINPFLRDLRALDVACILLHHAGKDSKRGLRGASAMGAMAHNIFRLSNHGSKDITDGEAWFTLSKDKQRSGGRSFPNFSLHFTQGHNDKETHWEVTE